MRLVPPQTEGEYINCAITCKKWACRLNQYFSHVQFLNPAFLWALSLLAIPVLVHLFNFRRFKTVYFSNVAFLKEVKEETNARSKLKHLLVLASRLLAMAFIVLAFAQPFIPGKSAVNISGKKFVSVFVDNSFSMNANSNNRALLEKARLTAREIVKAYDNDDRFQLLTHDFDGMHQRLVNKDEFLKLLDEVKVSAASRTWKDIARRQQDALSRESNENHILYWLSDFQKSMGTAEIDTTTQYNLAPLVADAQANLYIDSCWFTEPLQLINAPASLNVKVANAGETERECTVVLKLNGQTKSMNTVTVPANTWVYDTIPFTPTSAGWIQGELSVNDFPITNDDKFFFAFEVVEKVHVLNIANGRPNKYLNALLGNLPEFALQSVAPENVTAELVKQHQTVICDHLSSFSPDLVSTLNSFVASGGTLIVVPGERADFDSYNRLFNSMQANAVTGLNEETVQLNDLDTRQQLLQDVFERIPTNAGLPGAFKYYTFSTSSRSNEQVILMLKNQMSLASCYPYQAGRLYVFATPFNTTFTELPGHALFIPLLYKMSALQQTSKPLSYEIGEQTRIEVPVTGTKDGVYKIKGNGTEWIPQQFNSGSKTLLGLGGQVTLAGFYDIMDEKNEVAGLLALNYNRRESDLRFDNAEALKQMYNYPNVKIADGSKTEVAAIAQQLNTGTALWKWCLLLALLFLAAETALIRFWKA